MRLECGPCRVRSWQASDLESLVRHANNRKIWQNLRDRFPHPYTTADGQAWLRHARAAEPETDYAIEVGGAAVGGIGLIPGTDVESCSAEIGYWLGESVWGKGVATAAVRAVTAHAFASPDLRRIFATVFIANLPSRRVLEKAGFALEGIMRCSAIKDGQILDRALYALVNERD